jgi:hypothetical protein
MRRATVTLTDEIEGLLDEWMARLETPPSLNVLMQAALRAYLLDQRPGGRGPPTVASAIAEEPARYGEGGEHTPIELDPETEAALRQAAAREGTTASALAATLLRLYVRGIGRPLPRGHGAYRSGRSDVSSRAEQLLRSAARKARR